VVSGLAMVGGGVALAVGGWAVPGVSVAVAGVVALATLAPPVQAWLVRQQHRGRAGAP
jgi:hypothetical protein